MGFPQIYCSWAEFLHEALSSLLKMLVSCATGLAQRLRVVDAKWLPRALLWECQATSPPLSLVSFPFSVSVSLSVTDSHTLSLFHTPHTPPHSVCVYLEKALRSTLSKAVPILGLCDGLSHTPHLRPLALILSLQACQLPEDRLCALFPLCRQFLEHPRHVVSSQ